MQDYYLKPKTKKGFQGIDKIIPEFARQHKLEQALYRHKVLKHWEQVVAGFIEEAAVKSKAVDLKDGILTVACLCKETAYQIRQLAGRIIYALNQALGKMLVKGIRVEV